MHHIRMATRAFLAGNLALAGAAFVRAANAPDGDITPLMSYQPNQSFTVNAYIGMVNGEPLFVENILRPIDSELQRIARIARNIGEFRSGAREIIETQMNRRVYDSLIEKAAKDTLNEEDNRRVEAYMNRETKDLLTHYEGSAAKADQSLRAQGSSMEKMLADKKRDFTVQLYLHKVLYPKIIVTRKQILEEYQRNLKAYTVQPEVDLYTITLPIRRFLPTETAANGRRVPISRPTPEQVRDAAAKATARAQELIAQLRQGAEFAKVAEDESTDPKAKEGGRWPHTQKGMLASKQIEETAFALAPHSIADPVVLENPTDPTLSAVVIIKVEDVVAGHIIPFSEAQKTIDNRLREQQFRALTREYYDKLRKKAAIEGVDRMVDTVTDAAVTRYLVK